MEIRVGTFNILNTSCRYEERKHLIKDSISNMDCDILGLQEVNLQTNPSDFDLAKYSFIFAPLPEPMLKPEPEFRIDGNAVLIKKSINILENSSIIYSNNLRLAQILKLSINSFSFYLVNTHLDHLSDTTREIQLSELLPYLSLLPSLPVICTGDYNFLPSSRPYKLISSTFQSSHKTVHKKEPQITFPTGLLGPHADLNAYGCFDYIWVKGSIEVKNCQVLREVGKGSLWASDHYPVFADLKLI